MIRGKPLSLLVLAAFAVLGAVGPGLALAQAGRAYVNADSISVGERVQLVVAVETSSGIDVTFPELPPDTMGSYLRFGDLLALAVTGRGTMRSAGIVADSVIYEATTFALDTARVSSIPVLLSSAGDTVVANTPPFLLPVRSVVPSGANDVMDLLPIAEFRPPIWPWLLFVVGLLAALGGFIFWYRRSRSEVVLEAKGKRASVAPHEEAYARLAVLSEIEVDSAQTAEEFCVELSNILRTYLWRRTAAHALEMTTGELVDRLRYMELDGVVPEELPETVDMVLGICDLAKFAEIFPEEEVCRQAVGAATRVVDDVEKHLTAALDSETQDEESQEPSSDSEIEPIIASRSTSEAEHPGQNGQEA